MYDGSEVFGMFVLGVALTAFITFMAFQGMEAGCQAKNNVYDCEWTQSPFTPVVPSAD